MNIVNLTPDTIFLYGEDHTIKTAAYKSSLVARVDRYRRKLDEIKGTPRYITEYGSPYLARFSGDGGVMMERLPFLPEPKLDTIYIVSSSFRAVFDRDDLWEPGEPLKDSNGQIYGYMGLSR